MRFRSPSHARACTEEREGNSSLALPRSGAAFAFLAPLLGWLGTAARLRHKRQRTLGDHPAACHDKAGIDPTLLVAANTSGGVVGKMISPQNLTIAATAVRLLGREADILRRVLPWRIGPLIAVCLLVGLRSTVLAWMLS